LRTGSRVLASLDKGSMEVTVVEGENIILVRRWREREQVAVLYNFEPAAVACSLSIPAGHWRRLLDSADSVWLGEGSSTPDIFESTGDVQLKISANSVVVLAKDSQ
jgi:maltooligosyltrehalose trehalohydrolase